MGCRLYGTHTGHPDAVWITQSNRADLVSACLGLSPRAEYNANNPANAYVSSVCGVITFLIYFILIG